MKKEREKLCLLNYGKTKTLLLFHFQRLLDAAIFQKCNKMCEIVLPLLHINCLYSKTAAACALVFCYFQVKTSFHFVFIHDHLIYYNTVKREIRYFHFAAVKSCQLQPINSKRVLTLDQFLKALVAVDGIHDQKKILKQIICYTLLCAGWSMKPNLHSSKFIDFCI